MASVDLGTEFTLPCGLTLKNRIVKAPMTVRSPSFATLSSDSVQESLADARNNLPNDRVFRVYERWAKGGLGLIITGNVPVDRDHLEAPRNIVLDSASEPHLELFHKYANACKVDGCHVIVQITHAGRQTSGAVNKSPKAPSNVALEMEGIPSFLLAKPVAMTTQDVQEVRLKFVETAKLVQKAGFDGVQCHAAHGYLLSEFLNPKVNVGRTDQYGGSLENRMRLLQEIVRDIRTACGPSFCVSVKLNSADFQQGGSTEEDNLVVLAMLEKETVDFVEVSGGNYEAPAMVGIIKRESTKKREAYFLEFGEAARKSLKIPLCVTGGFRNRDAMNEALQSGACDLIGLARPLCLDPEFPNKLLRSPTAPKPPSATFDWNAVHGTERGFESFWHTLQIQRMADGLDPDLSMKPNAVTGNLLRQLIYEPTTGALTRWITDAVWPIDTRGQVTRWALIGGLGALTAYLARGRI